MTLAEALAAAAADLDRVQDERHEWSVGEVVFAAMTAPDTAEFRLEPIVAHAALGTPDTGPSARGADWVEFRPKELDRFALDRAIAWLGSAYRNARKQ